MTTLQTLSRVNTELFIPKSDEFKTVGFDGRKFYLEGKVVQEWASGSVLGRLALHRAFENLDHIINLAQVAGDYDLVNNQLSSNRAARQASDMLGRAYGSRLLIIEKDKKDDSEIGWARSFLLLRDIRTADDSYQQQSVGAAETRKTVVKPPALANSSRGIGGDTFKPKASHSINTTAVVVETKPRPAARRRTNKKPAPVDDTISSEAVVLEGDWIDKRIAANKLPQGERAKNVLSIILGLPPGAVFLAASIKGANGLIGTNSQEIDILIKGGYIELARGLEGGIKLVRTDVMPNKSK